MSGLANGNGTNGSVRVTWKMVASIAAAALLSLATMLLSRESAQIDAELGRLSAGQAADHDLVTRHAAILPRIEADLQEIKAQNAAILKELRER